MTGERPSRPAPDTLVAEAALSGDWAATVGEDLASLINASGFSLHRVVPLPRLDAPQHRSATFCLELSDGRRFKARRAWSAERAGQIAYFLELLDAPGFPAVIDRRKRGLLLEWVEGQTLCAPVSAEHLDAAARLMGRLHTTRVPQDCPYPCSGDPKSFSAGIERAVSKLVAVGAMATAQGEACLRLAFDSRPSQVQTGIIHTDLCPDNLVVESDGNLRAVDNESLQIGCLDLDLARTWYRWPLSGAAGSEFLAAYGQFRSTGAFTRHFPFWFIGVLLESAVYRLESPTRAWATPLARLQDFLADPLVESCHA